MDPKHTVCEGNVNWVNVAHNGINWRRNGDLLFYLQCSYNVLLGRRVNFSSSDINFTYTDVVNFVHILMGDTHNDMQPAQAAYEKFSFVIRVGS